MEILIRPQLQGSLQTECHSSSCQQGRYLSTVEYPSNAVHSTSNGRIQPEDADGQCSPQRSPKVQPSLLPCYQHRIQGVIRILRRSDSTKGPASTTPSTNVCTSADRSELRVDLLQELRDSVALRFQVLQQMRNPRRHIGEPIEPTPSLQARRDSLCLRRSNDNLCLVSELYCCGSLHDWGDSTADGSLPVPDSHQNDAYPIKLLIPCCEPRSLSGSQMQWAKSSFQTPR